MPAKSKAQQRLMGLAYGNPEVRKQIGIKKKDARKFAKTKHDGLPERVGEAMDFTEFCKYLDEQEKELTYEAKLPQCPPGYVYSRERKDCIPKTEKDKVSGRLNTNNTHSGASYKVFGRTGLNGDGYAFEDKPGIDINGETWGQ